MAIRTKKIGAKHGRKAVPRRSQRRAASRRADAGAVTATASPYREFERDYASALWL